MSIKLDFCGLWYTSEGYFVEVISSTEGFILDENGIRQMQIQVDQWGYLKPNGGRLEISRRSVEDTVVEKGRIDKGWPLCQTQF
jgi:hypothetical protein